MSDLDQSYIDAIKRFEGYSAKPYWDVNAWRSGHGTHAKSRDETIDEQEADARLRRELANASAQVDKKFPQLSPGARAALTSLTYNAGPSWMTSGLGDAVARGDMDAARELMLQYSKSAGKELPGLKWRRGQEASWLGGKPSLSPITLASVQRALGGKAADLPSEPNAEKSMQMPTQMPTLASFAPKQRSLLELYNALNPQANDLRSLYL